jgi:hypothetical protein
VKFYKVIDFNMKQFHQVTLPTINFIHDDSSGVQHSWDRRHDPSEKLTRKERESSKHSALIMLRKNWTNKIRKVETYRVVEEKHTL